MGKRTERSLLGFWVVTYVFVNFPASSIARHEQLLEFNLFLIPCAWFNRLDDEFVLATLSTPS